MDEIQRTHGVPSVFNTLRAHTATLHNQVWLSESNGAAIWSNQHGQTEYCKPGHHTLSFYLQGGERTRRVSADGESLFGGPDKVCLMPAEHRSHWSFSQPFRFFHFYFSQDKLVSTLEKTFDKEGRHIELKDETFVDEPYIANLIRHVFISLDWHDHADQVAVSHASEMLLIHLLRHHCDTHALPLITSGGLATHVARRVDDFINENLELPLTLGALAEQAQLSEFHFARMFRQHFNKTPHQYVLEMRIRKAKELLAFSSAGLADIALQSGFSSQQHFSNQFKKHCLITPAKYRKETTK